MWIGERHASIVCTFDQPLLSRHVVVPNRLRPVDVELRRFQWWHHRELLGVGTGGVWGLRLWLRLWLRLDVGIWVRLDSWIRIWIDVWVGLYLNTNSC
jgi:hypothetical protein